MAQQTPPAPPPPPSQAELAEVLEKHISYELGRLIAQYKLLREPKYREALDKEDAENIDDALIVSFCSHARNFLEFLSQTEPTPGKKQPTKPKKPRRYARAVDYGTKPGYAPLERIDRVGDLYQQLCEQINHLTYYRTDETSKKIDVAERNELIEIIHDEFTRLAGELKHGLDKNYFLLDRFMEARLLVKVDANAPVGASSEVQVISSQINASLIKPVGATTTVQVVGPIGAADRR